MLPRAVRVKFTKVGSLQFISHLDLNRTMKSVMIRAKVPIHYSEGFNPHPKMVFALPLSIGAESMCEFLDFKIDEELENAEIMRRLNGALSPEMRVVDVYEPTAKFTEIGFAEYEIGTDETFHCAALDAPVITVSKRTKSGVRETDIKPMIHHYEVMPSGIRCVLQATPDAYLNPEYLASLLGLKDYTIMRTRVFRSDGVTEFH